MEQRVLRVGTFAVISALILRLIGMWSVDFVLSPEAASWMIFLQTGRVVRQGVASTVPTQPSAPTTATTATTATTTPTVSPTVSPTIPVTTAPVPTAPTISIPTFSAADASAIQIKSSFSWTADLGTLLTQPLTWDLTGDAPTVLILHSHATEGFSDGGYKETSPYHTLDPDHNMLSIGAYVAARLRAAGISVIQDTAVHDEPSYDLSYTSSRKSIQDYLAQYPTIRLVLDLHRDSYEDAQGNQASYTVFSQGQAIAPLMFVVGTDYGGLTHPNWQQNFALALKLQTQLENLCPGICRNINLRTQRFNQDLSGGALLVEVGSCGNTYAEAIGGAEMLAQAVISLAHGSK